jgi:hypothetical protein
VKNRCVAAIGQRGSRVRAAEVNLVKLRIVGHVPSASRRQVVNHVHAPPVRQQRLREATTDEAAAAGYQDTSFLIHADLGSPTVIGAPG